MLKRTLSHLSLLIVGAGGGSRWSSRSSNAMALPLLLHGGGLGRDRDVGELPAVLLRQLLHEVDERPLLVRLLEEADRVDLPAAGGPGRDVGHDLVALVEERLVDLRAA